MNATFKRIIALGIAFIVIALAAAGFVVSGGCSAATEGDPLAGAKVGAVNTLIDTSGVKSRIEEELRTRGAQVAVQYGIPESIVDNAIDSLAIQDWKATVLPDDVQKTGTFQLEADDMSANVTTYDDPSIVTVEAYGQTVTMEVPESAQSYIPLLNYVQYAQSGDYAQYAQYLQYLE